MSNIHNTYVHTKKINVYEVWQLNKETAGWEVNIGMYVVDFEPSEPYTVSFVILSAVVCF